ncbi:TCP-1/cpn60 chaperonin family protein [Methermicoccus shengliensis]|uniref:Uncharacterized protein n=1 Tax=Methermicoccus shengliensis TaxID=660064 RepID=A0A832RY54_9EURY|nr:TCP-1/cpn60 chaperonin family protein [Methermicoccus shengliensis]HIH69531.1 hypothetical protein [Methermicoccus shengliensis]
MAGGGTTEFILSQMLKSYACTLPRKEQLAVLEFARALEAIPMALASNAGMNPTDALAAMRNYYTRGIDTMIDSSGRVTTPSTIEPVIVKKLALTSATEAANRVLMIDEIVPKR